MNHGDTESTEEEQNPNKRKPILDIEEWIGFWLFSVLSVSPWFKALKGVVDAAHTNRT